MTSHIYQASKLSEDNYFNITRNMITGYDPYEVSARISIKDESVITGFDGLPNVNTSFVNQIADSFFDKPAAYAVTARSAIPVADSIRGFYNAVGHDAPPIITIQANRETSRDHIHYRYQQSRYEKSVKDPSLEEIDRLKTLIGDFESLDIVDQYVDSGRTIKYAAYLAKMAGVNKVHAIRGTWYHEAQAERLDTENVTSEDKKFMYNVGLSAAKLAVPSFVRYKYR